MLKVWESLWNTETLQLWDVTSCDNPTLCKVTGFKHPQPSCQSSKDNSLRIFLQIQSWVRLLEDHRKKNWFIQRCLNWYCGCAGKLGHTPKFGCFNRDCEWLRWLNSGMGYPIFNLHQKKGTVMWNALGTEYCFCFYAFLRNGDLPYSGCLVALVISGCPSNHRQSQWQGMDAAGGPHFLWWMYMTQNGESLIYIYI